MPRPSTAQQRIATVPSTIDPTTDKSKLARQIEIIKKLREHERYNKIEYYDRQNACTKLKSPTPLHIGRNYPNLPTKSSALKCV